jgi:ATP phosphoribosyltransferase
LAEVIVDISTTGNTLLANRLRRVGAPVLKSEAVLASGLDCKWPDAVRRARDEIAVRVAGA